MGCPWSDSGAVVLCPNHTSKLQRVALIGILLEIHSLPLLVRWVPFFRMCTREVAFSPFFYSPPGRAPQKEILLWSTLLRSIRVVHPPFRTTLEVDWRDPLSPFLYRATPIHSSRLDQSLYLWKGNLCHRGHLCALLHPTDWTGSTDLSRSGPAWTGLGTAGRPIYW